VSGGGYTRADLEPLSFDDLPLGGEWTTRRRTVTESDIALYAGVAGDFSPLTIEAAHGTPRPAPPALVLAMAIGLGSMDMPIPSVAEWEWLNWRFPRPVHAGDTIYARWTLTQKRPPAREAPNSIVVWRVDVHTADGALCAEGEVGAKVKRQAGKAARPAPREAAAPPTAAAPAAGPRTRRRRRRPAGNGAAAEAAARVAPAAPAPQVKAAAPAGAPAKRRRRRRAPASTAPREKPAGAAPAPPSEATAAPKPAATPAQSAVAAPGQGALGRVISRLRRA
jgi:acyl dehydratase